MTRFLRVRLLFVSRRVSTFGRVNWAVGTMMFPVRPARGMTRMTVPRDPSCGRNDDGGIG